MEIIKYTEKEIENIFKEIKKGYNYVLNETNCKSDQIHYLAPEWFINILKEYCNNQKIQEYSFYVPKLGYVFNLQPHYKNEIVVFNKNYAPNQKCSNYIIQLDIDK